MACPAPAGCHNAVVAPELPAGLVTFLLTDVEGSTRLFRRLGEAWPALLDRHLVLLRGACRTRGGGEFKSEGDALLFAFDDAGAALTAAVEAQAALEAEPWPEDAVIRVRMGLHSGIAYPRDGDYIALALHQAARVVAAANGGQVLASADAVAAAGAVVGIDVERLGAFRLRDFDGPAELWQVAATGCDTSRFAAPRAVPADGHNLEMPGDEFVGRSDELRSLADIVVAGRIVTLCGSGGVGKTRLATEYALRAAASWSDGAWFIDLTTVGRGHGIGPAVAATLGVAAVGDDVIEALVEYLRCKQALIILDNCEHVVDGVAVLLRRLVPTCGLIAVLATSRERLEVRGETVIVLPPLPPADACVELFSARARRRGVSIASEGERGVVLQICERVDGLPLAVELAASQMDVMSPSEMLDRITDRLATMHRRRDRGQARQRSLRALIDWSYDLLEPTERAVLRRVSVFVGSFDTGTAEAAAGDVASDDVVETIWSLVDKSLLATDRRDGATRYRMLATVRAVAAAYLDEAGEAGACWIRLAETYIADFPIDGRGTRGWRSRVADEQATMTQLAEQLIADGAVDLGLAVGRLAVEHSLGILPGKDSLTGVLQLIERAPDRPGAARLHAIATKLAGDGNDLVAAAGHLAECRRLVAELGPDDMLGRIPLARAEAWLSMRTGSAEDLSRAAGHLRGELQQPLTPTMRTDVLVELGMVLGALGDQSSRAILHTAVDAARELADHALLASALSTLAEFDLRVGDRAAAAAHQWEAMRISAELGLQLLTAFGLVLAARIAQPAGHDAAAVRLHGRADVLLQECDFELHPDDRLLSDEMLESARRHLGPGFAEELNTGRALPLTTALELADEIFHNVPPSAQHQQ